MKKICFKCGIEKDLSEFYKHNKMKDGRLNKCIDCTKSDVIKHRVENIEKIRAYDRARGSRHTPEYLKQYKARYPIKYKARTMVGNAIRDGKLFKDPCCVCGTAVDVHAHHCDYSKPLNVMWLCAVHHSEWHQKNGEGINGE